MAAPVLCDRFVGRTKELDVLLERFRHAVDGRGAMVLLGGEAGIGKSRVVTEFLRRINPAQAQIATAGCFEYARSPFGPFTDALRQLGASGGVPTAPNKREQLAAIGEMLGAAARRLPAVVVIEDIHWADHATLELLQFLAAVVATHRFVLVATYRTDELQRRHPLTPALARILRSEYVWHTILKPFSATEMNAFISGALRGRDSPDFPVLTSIKALSEGNPLFAEELLRNALEAGTGTASLVALTPSLSDAVLARFALLAEEDQLVVVQAAVLGREFDPQQLAVISNRTLDDVRGILKRARNLQFVIEQPEGSVPYAFRHALTQEALCGELLAEELRELHARILATLESSSPDAVTELAYHSWAARAEAKAVRYNVAAADSAVALCAFSDAVTLYERALEFLKEPSLLHAEIQRKIAESLFHAGSSRSALRRFERTLAEYDALGDGEAAVRICEQLVYVCFCVNAGDACLAWCARAADRARAVAGLACYQEVFAFIAKQAGILGDLNLSLKYLDEAVRRGPPQTAKAESLLLQVRGLATVMGGGTDAGLADLRRSIAAIAPSGPADATAVAFANLAIAACELGRDEIAIPAQAEALRLAREHRLPIREMLTLGLHAEAALRRGDYTRALAHVNEAVPLFDIVDFPGFMYARIAAVSIRLAVRTKRAELFAYVDVERMLETAFASCVADIIASVGGAFVERLAAEARLADAASLLHRAIPAVGDGLSRAPLLVLAAAYADPSDLPLARASLDRWAQPENIIGLAQTALFDAEVSRRNGERVNAQMHAERAIELFHQFERPHDLAHALELTGQSNEAVAIYERIGDVYDAERVRLTMKSVNRRGRERDELTRREREIATLVAEGMSNRAVAETVAISERTVEKHLGVIFGKLGVVSRTNLAIRLARNAESGDSQG